MDDLITWLRAVLDDDERLAREASRSQHGDGHTLTGEHWRWEEPKHDQELVLDPVLDEYLNQGQRVALRSVEQYPSSSVRGLPHFVVSYAEEVRTVDAMHIARWDPARVLAQVAADRALIAECERTLSDEDHGWALAETVLRIRATAYADRPGYLEVWTP